eukprot:595606-Pleurochrysis_carterae.AAC.1
MEALLGRVAQPVAEVRGAADAPALATEVGRVLAARRRQLLCHAPRRCRRPCRRATVVREEWDLTRAPRGALRRRHLRLLREPRHPQRVVRAQGVGA